MILSLLLLLCQVMMKGVKGTLASPFMNPTSAPLMTPSPLTPSTTTSTTSPSTGFPSLSPSSVFIISTAVGTGTASYSGDGNVASSATLYTPYAIAFDASDNLYIADTFNHRIRKVTISTSIITTIVGGTSSGYSGDNGLASSASLFYPSGVALDTSGNVYISDTFNQRIRKVLVSSVSIITTIAGTGSSGFSGDSSLATFAKINNPYGITLDSAGNLYVCDTYNNRVRKVATSTSIITTIAGSGYTGMNTGSYSGDTGQATSAALNCPMSVSLDLQGNVYIADAYNNRIRKVTVSTGIIDTIVGSGGTGTSGSYTGDGGLATSATLFYPYGVNVDASGNIYITDYYNNRIRKVTISTGTINTIAGTGSGSFSGDGGEATAAALKSPYGSARDSAGNIYITDSYNNRIRKVAISTGSPSISPTVLTPSPTASNGYVITTIAGAEFATYSGDSGQATSASLNYPYGVALDSSGNVYIADSHNHRVRKVTISTGIITTIAGKGGTGSLSGDGSDASSAFLYYPQGVALDSSGNIYIADASNHRIRKVTVSTGIINTIAGSSTSGGYSGDNGAATSANLLFPTGVTVDTSGNVYIADTNNNRIRKVTGAPSAISTVAGKGSIGYGGDNGAATSANIAYPQRVIVDAAGNLYIADTDNYRIRKVTISTGIITTIAGNGGTGSYSGDGGAATLALLNYPTGLALDSTGNVYIADQSNQCIRKVTISTGIMSTVVGTGSAEFSGDGGAASSATVYNPAAVEVDSSGNLYIADQNNHRIRKATLGGMTSPSLVPTTAVQPSLIPTMIPTTSPSISPSTVYLITTIAGTGTAGFGSDGVAATSTTLFGPHGVNVDSSGNVFIADTSNSRIRKVTVSTGIITTFAGTGSFSYSGDSGQATSAGLNSPKGLAIDSAGNAYITDTYNNRIRKVTTTGVISTIAGNSLSGNYGGDGGAATSALLNYPSTVALDASGNVFIADQNNNRIRKVTISTGIISTIAGSSALSGYDGDGGAATSALLYNPFGVSLDSAGNVYISDSNNNCIRKVTISTGIITTIAGTGTAFYSGDNGPATSATIFLPYAISLDSSGNLYIADSLNQRIRKVDTSGVITTIAGSSSNGGYNGDNMAATSATLQFPYGVAVDSKGNVYIAEYSNNRIRKVAISTSSPSMSPTSSVPVTLAPSTSSDTILITIAGSSVVGSYGGDNGPATSANLNVPYSVTVDSSGNLYIADCNNNRIRKVTVSTGIITTVAGKGAAGFSGDNGPATAAEFNLPYQAVVDASGNIYVSDIYNNRIRKVTVSTGIITTIAGSSTSGSYCGENNQAAAACLFYPEGLVLDASGNVYIADSINNRIRKVTVSTGIITTIAGNGASSYSGDTGQATAASLQFPQGVTLDAVGNVFIGDTNNHCIRKVTVSTGIITTYAGTGTASYSGDNGLATSAGLSSPKGIAIDSSGNLYIADTVNQRIRKVDTTSVITTIAGSSTSGSYNGDNIAATSSYLNNPYGVTVDSTGNVYIADTSNNRIRKIIPSTSSPSTIPSITPTTSMPSNSPSASPTTAQPSSNPTVTPTMTPSKTPTTSPSTSPTVLQPSSNPTVTPTRVPSYVPSLAPSTYPTYTSIAHVYFLATHGLIGVTASLYLNNQASNDAVFMQTVASVIGYDSNIYDVRILSVTDSLSLPTTTSSRSLGTSVGMIMKYSVTTSSRLFNSTNLAITRFMQSLNASVLTGEFDRELHSNAATKGATDLIGVNTDYVILTTASPTSSPTSTPTSSPTKKDIVAVNLLEVPLDSEVARVKVKYYLGAFVGYFLTIYVCLYLYSLLRYGNVTARKLYDAAYQSEEYIRSSAITGENKNNVSILSDLYMKNILVQSAIRADDELKQVKKTAPRIEMDDKEDMKNKYSKGYREYVDQRRTLLGCSACLYPDGCEVRVPCRSSETVFPPGRVENILLYICYNHPLFSCFYFMDGSKLGAHGTRILYIGKFIVVFVMYQFSNMLLQYFMLDGHGLGTLINLFIITPSAMSVGLLLKYLYTCPFTETVEFQRKYAKYQALVLFLGRLAIIPIMFIMCISLFFACLFSSGHRIPAILVKFFFNVQLYGVLLEVVKAALLFVDNYYYQLSLFGVLDILCIGKLYKERIMAEQQVVGVDYAYRIHNYLFGLIKVQKILNRDDAIKAQWITVGADDQYDVEMKGDDRSSGFVVQNPLALAHVTTNTAVVPDQDDAEREYITNNIPFSSVLPIPIVTEHVVTHHSEPLHIQHIIAVKEEKVVEDDATLFLEYQSLQSQHDEAVFDTNSNDDVAISFEEWKSKRKQFKQGTRGSFVKAFQMFEEREQLARDHLDHSASVANAMHLYKGNNVLAKKGPVKPK